MNKPKSPTADEGAWEPLMFVAALAGAVWLGYSLYGDRIFSPDRSVAGHASSRSVADDVFGAKRMQLVVDRKGSSI